MADDDLVDRPPDFKTITVGRLQAEQDAGKQKVDQDTITQGILGAFGRAVSFVVNGVGDLMNTMVSKFFGAIESLSPAFGSLAATIVGNLFDVDVSSASFTNLYNASSRKQAGVAVGAALLKGITGGAGAGGSGTIVPSVAPAEQYLGLMANLAIEGWLFDLAGSIVPEWHFEHIGELNEIMARVLGLGRLSRTVLHPFVNATVTLPATWYVNKAYRPKLLTPAEAIRESFRGYIDDAAAREICAREGYSDDAYATLQHGERKYHSPADIAMLVQTGAWTPERATLELRDSGHESDRADEIFLLEKARAVRHHQLALADAAVSAYAESRIDTAQLDNLVASSGLDDTTTNQLIELAHQRRICAVKHMSRAEVESAVKLKVLSVTDYRDHLTAANYADEDALTLELLLQAELQKLDDAAHLKAQAAADRAAAKATKLLALQAKKDLIAAEHADWSGSLAQAERLVVRGLLPAPTYRQALIDHGISGGDASALTQLATNDAAAYADAQAKKAAAAVKTKTPGLSLGALEHAVVLGALSLAQFESELAARNYADGDIATIVGVLQAELAHLAAAQTKRDALAAAAAVKGISIAQEEAAVVAGASTLDQYRALLTARKYSAADVATLVSVVQHKLDVATLTAQRQAAAAAKLATAKLSLAAAETAVRDGLEPMTWFAQYLTDNKFTPDDVAILVGELAQLVAKDKAAAAAHTKATTALGAKGLSLSEVDAAVIAAIWTPAQYAAWLTTEKFTPDEVQLLVDLITPKITAAQQAADRRAALELEPGQKAVTLGEVRKAVVDGVQSAAYYQQWLEANGYAPADVQLLVDDVNVALAAKAAKGSPKTAPVLAAAPPAA